MDLSGLELEIGQARDRAFRLRTALAPLNAGKSDRRRRLHLRAGRLPAVAQSAHRQRDGRGERDPGAAAMRVLRARRSVATCCKTVEQVKETLNPELTIHGIVLTMFDARNNLSNQVVADVREFMGAQGLRHHHPAQRARLGSAVLRQAGAGLRSEVRRQRSLSAARDRNHPARERTARGELMTAVARAERACDPAAMMQDCRDVTRLRR